MKSKTILEGYFSEEISSVDQPTRKHIEALCIHLNLPLNKEIAMALIYGDNTPVPERVLPVWLKEFQ